MSRGGPGAGRGLEFLGALAGGLVHEIKNPLSTLRINLTLLKEDLAVAVPGDRGLVHRLEVLETEVRRLDAVLNDFLRYAGMRRLEKETVEPAALVAELVEFLAPSCRRDGIELVAGVGPGTAPLDAQLFKRALFNLLLNAQQALGQGGRIAVTGAIGGGRGWIEIADDGPGIPAGELERVFDVYYSRSRQGSGLGLPTARRILEEHDGTVQLFSEEGAGTRVRLEFPAA